MTLKHFFDSSFTAVETLKFLVTASSIIVISHKKKESETSSTASIKQTKIFIDEYNETVSQQLSVNWQAVAAEVLHKLMKTKAHQNTIIHY